MSNGDRYLFLETERLYLTQRVALLEAALREIQTLEGAIEGSDDQQYDALIDAVRIARAALSSAAATTGGHE